MHVHDPQVAQLQAVCLEGDASKPSPSHGEGDVYLHPVVNLLYVEHVTDKGSLSAQLDLVGRASFHLTQCCRMGSNISMAIKAE